MLQAYSIFDKKVGSYGPPYWVKHIEEFIRSLRTELENPKSSLARFASDYAVYRVGHFEQDTGAMMPPAHTAPEHVTELVALFPSIPPQQGA